MIAVKLGAASDAKGDLGPPEDENCFTGKEDKPGNVIGTCITSCGMRNADLKVD